MITEIFLNVEINRITAYFFFSFFSSFFFLFLLSSKIEIFLGAKKFYFCNSFQNFAAGGNFMIKYKILKN
jgi:hypothetical protein